MNRHRYVLLIFYTDCRIEEFAFWNKTWRRRVWLVRRRPRLVWSMFLTWFTKVWTMSPYAHVSPCASGVVLHFGMADTRFWSILEYLMTYPTVQGMHVIYSPVPIDLSRYEGHDRKYRQAWMSLLKLFPFGLIRVSDDCADITRDTLAQAGVMLPRRVTSPAGIYRYLRRRRYEWRPLPTNGTAPECRSLGG